MSDTELVVEERSGTDPIAARTLLERVFSGRAVRLEPSGGAFSYRFRSVGDGRVALNSGTIAAAYSGVFDATDRYVLTWSAGGPLSVEDLVGGTFAIAAGRPVMVPLGPVRMAAVAGTRHSVVFAADFLEAAAVAGTDRTPRRLDIPVQPDPERVSGLRKTIAALAPELLRSGCTESERVDADVELALAVLHAFAPVLVPAPSGRSGAVERAKDYIRARADGVLTSDGIAESAGVSVRTLQQAFVDECGSSPMQYLHHVRLENARDALRRSTRAESTVRELARASGFRHMGRFAADYLAEFDELPSTTLRRPGTSDALSGGRGALADERAQRPS